MSSTSYSASLMKIGVTIELQILREGPKIPLERLTKSKIRLKVDGCELSENRQLAVLGCPRTGSWRF